MKQRSKAEAQIRDKEINTVSIQEYLISDHFKTAQTSERYDQ